VNRLYVIGAALIIAGALIFHPPVRQPAPVLTEKDVRPLVRATKPQVQSVTVYVVGAVARSGVYALRSGTRIRDAVSLAGGLTAQADPAGVNLAELLTDGQEIDVPLRGQAADRTTDRTSSRHSRRQKHSAMHRASKHRKAAPNHPIDINTADEAALEGLPGVGSGLARRLVEFREINGPFHALDELSDVAGMTDRRIEQIAPYVTVR